MVNMIMKNRIPAMANSITDWQIQGKETADQKEIIDKQLYSLERIERVKKYEKLYDEAVLSHDPEKLSALETYYASGEWMEDYEADERGELPPDLKRGVLSQDALYELLEEAKQ